MLDELLRVCDPRAFRTPSHPRNAFEHCLGCLARNYAQFLVLFLFLFLFDMTAFVHKTCLYIQSLEQDHQFVTGFTRVAVLVIDDCEELHHRRAL
jgi:hypothetical protein